ncbi:MAG: 50S ribosomal protein L29 [Candidatus Calescibacterium sp.]|nr:50S ribosomal protein L29 [Candidatus Calescibacterium sp.]MCX7758340.1 50S ribosomal protein L29 [bacterium]
MKSRKDLELLRSMSYSDLVKELKNTRKEFFDNKMKSTITGELKPHLFSTFRKKIARIKYLMSTKRSDINENK